MKQGVIRLTLAALAALFVSTPAFAGLSDEQLSCAIDQLDERKASEIYEDFAASMTGQSSSDDEEVPLSREVFSCAQSMGLDRETESQFYRYSFCSVALIEARKRLSSAGFDADAFDAVLDIGPGRSNPVSDNFSEDHWIYIEGVLGELYPNGTVPTETMLAIAGYTVGANCAYQAQAKLQ